MIRRVLPAGAIYAALGHRVDLQPLVGDFIAAIGTVAVFAIVQAPLGHFNSCQVAPARALGRLGHRLLLHGVHARQPTDRLLVQFHRPAGVCGKGGIGPQLLAFFVEALARGVQIDSHAVYKAPAGQPVQARTAPRFYRPEDPMLVLILGLILFLGTHSVRIFAPDWAQARSAAMGENAWKGAYSVVSLVGFVLLVYGFGLARADTPVLYVPPAWMSHVTALLMLFAFIVMGVYTVPAGKLKPALKHPMLLAVKIWALAHLLANGDLASIVLFGAFLVWAVLDRISVKRRGVAIPEAGPVQRDVIAVVLGLVLYGLFIWKLHYWLIGVVPLVMS